MDDDLQQLEAELKRLRPAAPPARLVTTIEGALAQSPDAESAPVLRRQTRGWWVWAATLPVAAAVAVALVVAARQKTPSAGTPRVSAVRETSAPSADSVELYKPVSAENVLYAVSDEGVVTLDDGTAARRERLQFIDTITWKNSRTNASVRWTVPREEVRVVPVKFQ